MRYTDDQLIVVKISGGSVTISYRAIKCAPVLFQYVRDGCKYIDPRIKDIEITAMSTIANYLEIQAQTSGEEQMTHNRKFLRESDDLFLIYHVAYAAYLLDIEDLYEHLCSLLTQRFGSLSIDQIRAGFGVTVAVGFTLEEDQRNRENYPWAFREIRRPWMFRFRLNIYYQFPQRHR
ncbi:uncharacterized protein LOC127251257 isoform X2 [Andrographis paniculata]|uniref:uncharacterized protein LOC127251257 isoform X2 n=1 Tax=Andrographis paniculata TaxID=175694 RepID=UPI0021E7A3A5|nr:uncharacterized protein LOC127251257 isoform X2 [Andrographis paniculata]